MESGPQAVREQTVETHWHPLQSLGSQKKALYQNKNPGAGRDSPSSYGGGH